MLVWPTNYDEQLPIKNQVGVWCKFIFILEKICQNITLLAQPQIYSFK